MIWLLLCGAGWLLMLLFLFALGSVAQSADAHLERQGKQ